MGDSVEGSVRRVTLMAFVAQRRKFMVAEPWVWKVAIIEFGLFGLVTRLDFGDCVTVRM